MNLKWEFFYRKERKDLRKVRKEKTSAFFAVPFLCDICGKMNITMARFRKEKTSSVIARVLPRSNLLYYYRTVSIHKADYFVPRNDVECILAMTGGEFFYRKKRKDLRKVRKEKTSAFFAVK